MSSLYLLFLLLTIIISDINASHSNNWAVLVGASRYWFNYRHIANTLSIYHSIKRMGIPDSQIILMISDDMACNDRNIYKGKVKASHAKEINSAIEIYDDDVEVDYRGEECSVENLLKLLTNRVDENISINRRLLTDENSNILVYITGHGGDTFLKFHDKEEIQSQDLADAFQIMYTQKRYNEILFMIDTCQAATLYSYITAPNIIGIGSSVKDESSYSYMNDQSLGISLVDRFTHHTLRFFERGIKTQNTKLLTLFNSYSFKQLHSTAKWDFINFKRNKNSVKITDFFSAVTYVDLSKYSIIKSKSCNIKSKNIQKLLINTNHRNNNDNDINTNNYDINQLILFINGWYKNIVEMGERQLYIIMFTIFCGLMTCEMNF